jgi:hypothetical protein
VGPDQSVTRGQLEENCSATFRDFFEGFADAPFRFRFIRPTVGKVLLYLLLPEPGLGLCCSSVDVGKGSPGDGVAVMLLAPGAVVTMVGRHVLRRSIRHFVAGNADVALEPSVFDRDFSALEFQFLRRDPPTDALAGAFILGLQAQ